MIYRLMLLPVTFSDLKEHFSYFVSYFKNKVILSLLPVFFFILNSPCCFPQVLLLSHRNKSEKKTFLVMIKVTVSNLFFELIDLE